MRRFRAAVASRLGAGGLAGGLLLLAAGTACARNPATGKLQLSLVSESQARQMGQQAAREVEQSIGVYEDPALVQYVQRVGQSLAAVSHRPELEWSFNVIDDSAVNAFALPGGFIYVTRGILAHFGSEAELAAVLGHEIAHVTAKHSVAQISRAQAAQLGLGLGMVLAPDLAPFAGLLSGGLGLLLLRYGRDAEREADSFGVEYALKAGYDPREMLDVMRLLGSIGGEGGRLPQWLSTHPHPENRLERIEEQIGKLETPLEGLKVDRPQFLARLEGMVVGEDPRNGYFVDSKFLHPRLAFQVDFPAQWQLVNQAQAVGGVSPRKDALVAVSIAGTAPPRESMARFLAQEGVRGTRPEEGPIGGLPAAATYFQASTQQGAVEGFVAFIDWKERTFQLLGYTQMGQLRAYDETFRQALGSFRPLTDPEAINVEPARIALVRVGSEMTVEEFHRQHPSTAPVEEVARLNGMNPGDRIPAGTTMKRVVGGRRPQPRASLR